MGFIMVFPDLHMCWYACLSLEADTGHFHSSPLSVLRQDLSLEPRARRCGYLQERSFLHLPSDQIIGRLSHLPFIYVLGL